MSHGTQTVRIFIASSEELREHRDAFDLQVQHLGKRWRQEHGLDLQVDRWEDFLDAMSATRLQDEYNLVVKDSDVFVMLFRSKVGRYTEEEFDKAFGQFEATGRPCVYTYFHDEMVRRGAIDRDAQLSLWKFQARLKALGHFQTVYENPEGLLLHFTDQLEKLRQDGYFKSVKPPPPPPPPPLPPSPDLLPYLTRRAAHSRSRAAGQLDRRFVNLTLMIDRGLEFDGPRHEAQGHYQRLDELLTEHADVQAWVLVGLPGSGKSTVLQHHEMTTADAALQRLAGTAAASPGPGLDSAPTVSATPGATDADPRPELCIWHRLSEYDATQNLTPADWLTAPGRWPVDLPPLDRLRRQVRVRFLLDGLNEIKAPSRAGQLAAVDRWTDWAASEAARGDGLAPIFSVRTLDQSPMGGSGLEVRQIVLGPWTDTQIQAYCAHRLGENNTLWPAIEGDQALLKLSELPFNLWAQCELHGTLGRAAGSRAELLGGLFWQMLSRRIHDPALKKVPGLLGEADLRMIASGAWKTTLQALPDRHGCLVPWLDDAMRRLHQRGRQVSVTSEALLADLPRREGWATPEAWLQAVRVLQLIDEGGHDAFTGEPLLRCTHQLWQEFFAGRSIRAWPTAEPARLHAWLDELPTLELPDLDTTLQRLGVQEPLPPPDPSHWEEPVKLAVQLVPDPRAWIAALQPRWLPLAGRAAVGCRAALDEATLGLLRRALLARSRDAATDLRLRIEAGLILGELGDPRYEERQGPDGRYLWPRQWVAVPAGRYRIGDDEAPYDDEKPETEVELHAFQVAFAPVTNAEYRCFVEARGYEDERWWEGELAQRWRREGIRNQVEIDDWSQTLAEIRDDVDRWISVRSNLTPMDINQVREWAQQAQPEHEKMLDDWYGARRYDRPQEWTNPVFNAASQPVVGICLFEAQAYARWLAAQSGQPVRVPTEAEWEAVARCSARRAWPWGETAPERWQMNADPAHLRRTNPIGCFPSSDSPDGLVDLAGNVLEWTSSRFTDALDAEALNEQQATPDDLARRVVRGGSWSSSTVYCRPSCRFGYSPDYRDYYLGVRLVVSCPIQTPEP